MKRRNMRNECKICNGGRKKYNADRSLDGHEQNNDKSITSDQEVQNDHREFCTKGLDKLWVWIGLHATGCIITIYVSAAAISRNAAIVNPTPNQGHQAPRRARWSRRRRRDQRNRERNMH